MTPDKQNTSHIYEHSHMKKRKLLIMMADMVQGQVRAEDTINSSGGS